jgi:hypothetical protein
VLARFARACSFFQVQQRAGVAAHFVARHVPLTRAFLLIHLNTAYRPLLAQGWRPWLDLEHSTCYNNTNHWSAITDGKMKYIFNACEGCTFPPLEQLFNLTADPDERVGLDSNPAYALELAKWRGRMVAQFEAEGRGAKWVSDGKLLTRASETYVRLRVTKLALGQRLWI